MDSGDDESVTDDVDQSFADHVNESVPDYVGESVPDHVQGIKSYMHSSTPASSSTGDDVGEQKQH